MAKSGDNDTFPYASGGIGVPYTDGMISGISLDGVDTSLFLPTPNGSTYPDIQPIERGHMTDYYGNTSCVDANTTGHEIFAGDF